MGAARPLPAETERALRRWAPGAGCRLCVLFGRFEVFRTGSTAPRGAPGLLPEDLARLADAAGLRNILAHLYEEIDYETVAARVGEALQDFGRLVELYAVRLEEASGPEP